MSYLLAMDLDGTCLDHKGRTSNKLTECMETFSGRARTVFVTGRTRASAVQAIEAAGLQCPDYLISDVGNRVYRWTSDGLELDAIFEAFNKDMWQIVAGDTGDLDFDISRWAIPQAHRLVRRLGYWASSEQNARMAAEVLSRHPRVQDIGIVRWDGPTNGKGWWVDVLPPFAGKATAVSYVSLIEGIPSRQVVCVGDSVNDVDMLSYHFHGASPSNVTPHLAHSLRKRGRALKVMEKPGPDGTAEALALLTDSLDKSGNSMPFRESLEEQQRRSQLRAMKPLTGRTEALSPWPERLQNWGLKPAEPDCLSKWDADRILGFLSEGRNWWWETASQLQRRDILRRFLAIPVEFLLKRLNRYVSRQFKGSRLLGVMVSGSYLYAPRDGVANDLDLVLLLDRLRQPSIDVEIEAPGLRSAFPREFAKRLRFDRVGLGIVGLRSINATTQSPVVLQVAASMEGSGLPLFGRRVTDCRMPAFDLLCQAIKLLNNASSIRVNSHPDTWRKVALRCDEAHRSVLLAKRYLSIPLGCRDPGFPHIKAGAGEVEIYLRRQRRDVASVFLDLVRKLVCMPNYREGVTQ